MCECFSSLLCVTRLQIRSTIGIHRPFSALKFNIVESVSNCAREPPAETNAPEPMNVHTARVLRSVETQIRLLTLPARQFHHTPFTTCMVSEGLLALLSACSVYLKGKDLTVARDQIRVALGCLKVLGEVWPRTARNVRQLQTIAQSVLSLKQSTVTSTSALTDLHCLALIETGISENPLANDNDIFNSAEPGENLCDWFNFGDHDVLPWAIIN